MDFMASSGRAPRDLEFRLLFLLGVDVNGNDNSPKLLPIDLKNRQATKNTTASQGKSILLRNRSNFYGFKQSRWLPI